MDTSSTPGTPIDKAALLKELIASHTHVVSIALQEGNGSRVIPESVYEYSTMFLSKVHAIILDL